ncbi:VOC family protein [Pseudovibrio brasiliensis]|uniref:VOC family protein n=1 Tax=Pseudovibrio brasiliensis TaxID=1898042 RepID=A0ABX8ATZ8_9HYPH|nr:VOC family protein [Pseudovibrio brasiliensis]QUS58533.1 VOC family protein [Pseudovibrio brasiliensis]
MTILSLQHFNLPIAPGGDKLAREFYVDLLGFEEVERPESIRHRPGGWFSVGSINLHLSVQDPFVANKVGHPAFVVDDIIKLAQRLRDADYEVSDDATFIGYIRKTTHDPFGNRIELMQPEDMVQHKL